MENGKHSTTEPNLRYISPDQIENRERYNVIKEINGRLEEIPLSGGLVYSREPGTTKTTTTYADESNAIANTNPVVLDANGEATIYRSGDHYVIVQDADGNTVYIGPPKTMREHLERLRTNTSDVHIHL